MSLSTRNRMALGVAAVVLGFAIMRGCDRRKDANTSSTSLAPGVVKKIIVNPSSHRITIVTPTHEQQLFLPDRPSSISINQAGEASVTSSQMGTELKPFAGLQLSNQFRLAAGIDAFYYKKFDFGVGIAGKIGMYTPVIFAKASYLVYDNTQLGITFDSSTHVGALLVVRL